MSLNWIKNATNQMFRRVCRSDAGGKKKVQRWFYNSFSVGAFVVSHFDSFTIRSYLIVCFCFCCFRCCWKLFCFKEGMRDCMRPSNQHEYKRFFLSWTSFLSFGYLILYFLSIYSVVHRRTCKCFCWCHFFQFAFFSVQLKKARKLT